MNNVILLLQDIVGLKEPVSFRVFVTGEDYCNNPDMYEYWLEQEEDIPEDCSELILSGSLGNGKSTFAAFYTAYRVYLLFLNDSPQERLGLAKNTDIYILYFSVSITMAKRSGFSYLYDIFMSCKWFQEYAPINTNLKSAIEFTDRHFFIVYASAEGHQIGLNVVGFILDEANFRKGVGLGVEEEYEEVTQLYEQLLDRQLSRFAKADGTVNSFAILISSASYQSSFVAKRIEAVKNDLNTKVIISAAYEVKPESFSKETFEVFIGAGTVEPCIISSEDHRNKILQVAGILGTGEEEKFFRKVPINLKKAFERNIVLAIQNHCGVATNITSSFMSNMTYLFKSYVSEDEIPPIFQSFDLEASNEDDTNLIEYLLPDNIQYAEHAHSIFIDLSITGDTCGIGCHRYDGVIDGVERHTRVFLLHIRPPQFPYKTKISKIEKFIIDLSMYLNIVAVGSDQFQSSQMRQDINSELGLDDIRISIDSSDIPHNLWQRGLVEGKIRQVEDKLLTKEVQEAVHDWKKHRVLKAKGSTDDVMQACVGSYYLSETIGKNSGTLEDLYPRDVNLVGQRAMERFLRDSGYKTN